MSPWRSLPPAPGWRRFLPVFVVLAGLSLALFQGVDREHRWQQVTEDLLAGTDFTPQGAEGWRISEPPAGAVEDGVLRLQLDDRRPLAFALRRIPLPEDTRLFELRCEARLRDLDGRPGRIRCGRLLLLSLDAEGEPSYHLPHLAHEWLEDQDWRRQRGLVRVGDAVQVGDVGFHLHGSSGRLEVRDLRLVGVRENPWYRAASWILLLGWIVLGVQGLRRTFAERRPWPANLALGGVLGAILVGSTLPSSWTAFVGEAVRRWAPGGADERAAERELARATAPQAETSTATPENTAADEAGEAHVPGARHFLIQKLIRKSGHYLLYAALAVVVFLSWARRRASATFLFCLGVAILTEMLQFFSPGRSPTLEDVGIDLAGVGSAAVLLPLARAFARLRSRARGARLRTSRC